MHLQLVSDSFQIKKLCSRLCSSEVQFYKENGHFTFLRGLGATYDNNLRFIGKPIVDFLLVLIELFSLGVMGEMLQANVGSKLAILL